MVRCANRFKTAVSVFKGSAPCGTHQFPSGSLHTPYKLLADGTGSVPATVSVPRPIPLAAAGCKH